jgi:hypothetical protein
MEIRNKDDWWNVVVHHWDYLLGILADKLDFSCTAFEIPGDGKSESTGRIVVEELEHLKYNRDAKLARYFHAAWGLSSDSYAYSVPGWGQLCDLCSEEYVLYEEEELGNEYGLGCT